MIGSVAAEPLLPLIIIIIIIIIITFMQGIYRYMPETNCVSRALSRTSAIVCQKKNPFMNSS
jgi:hypothetical protein